MDLLKSAVISFESEYKDLIDVWKQLEVKGQGLAVINGVLLTGSVTFLTRADATFLLQNRWLLLVLFAALFTSIVIAVLVLRTQEVAAALYGQTYFALVEPLSQLSQDEFIERERNFYMDQIRLWRSSTAAIRVQIRKKGDRLLYGQVSMFVSLAILLVLFAVLILKHSP